MDSNKHLALVSMGWTTMTEQTTPFRFIQHGSYFYEVIFTDFKRATLDAWLGSFEQVYPMLRDAPWLRTLYDLRAMFTFTPYASAAFMKVMGREYNFTNSRCAFLVRQNVINSRLQWAIDRGQTRTEKLAARGQRPLLQIFFDRDVAMQWLNVDVPETEIALVPKNNA